MRYVTAKIRVSLSLLMLLLFHTQQHFSHCLLLIPCPQTNLVDKLQRNIFESNNGNNPYSPSNDGQFSLPRGVAGTATDVHGQILGQYLEQLFDYVDYGDGNGIVINANDGSLAFDADLKGLFIEAFVYNSIDDKIEGKCTHSFLHMYKFYI